MIFPHLQLANTTVLYWDYKFNCDNYIIVNIQTNTVLPRSDQSACKLHQWTTNESLTIDNTAYQEPSHNC